MQALQESAAEGSASSTRGVPLRRGGEAKGSSGEKFSLRRQVLWAPAAFTRNLDRFKRVLMSVVQLGDDIMPPGTLAITKSLDRTVSCCLQ